MLFPLLFPFMLSLMPRYTRPRERPMRVTRSQEEKFLALLSVDLAMGTTMSATSRNMDMSMRAPLTWSSSLCLQMLILQIGRAHV